MNTPAKKKGIIVSHTHWDRAWYLPFQAFRYRLVKMIDRLIELLNRDQSYNCFVLDGQTILLEDYLEIRPENAPLLKDLISSNKIQIGPWYILPDLFLVSGESIIRNLQIGHSMTDDWGSKMKIGYVPDPFGHIAQLPQILKGFDIPDFMFMRGMPEELINKKTLLFNWVAPDGSSVIAYYLKDGYLNASNLGYHKDIGRFDLEKVDVQEAFKQSKNAIDNLSEFYPNDLILLNNGMDHMPEQPEIPSLLNELNQLHTDIEIKHGSFSDFADLLREQPIEHRYKGNLLGNPHHPILLSTYSTRSYLKQQNHQSQSILEKIAEPISILQEQLTGVLISKAILDYSWKELLKNHPHDDICGCSADGVHKDNEVRFRHVVENGESIFIDAIENFQKKGFQISSKHSNDLRSEEVFVFNPNASEQTQWIETEVVFRNLFGEEEEVLAAYELHAFDSSGSPLEIEILETKAPYLKAEFIQFTWGRLYKIRIRLTAPSLGYELIEVFETKTPLSINSPVKIDSSVETDRFKISWDHESIDVFDKGLNQLINNIIQFEYLQDNGDTYTFSRASKEVFSSLERIELGKTTNSLEAHFIISVPNDLSNESIENIPIVVTIDYSNTNQLGFEINYRNTAKNGRLRVLFPVGFSTSKSVADGHFTFYENEKIQELHPSNDLVRYEPYPGELDYPTHFQGDFCLFEGPEFNSWVANRGLHEYELIEVNSSTFAAITLHRAVGYLSVSNGTIRRPHAGPSIEVPEAQCLRDCTAHLAWGISNEDRFAISNIATSFSHPFKARQLPVLQGERKIGSLPRSKSLLYISDPRLQLSCIKAVESSEEIILRIFNRSSEKVLSDIIFESSIREYCITNLYEEWNQNNCIRLDSKTLPINIDAHTISTYRIRF
jgi:mannosylglycerate hydrolase